MELIGINDINRQFLLYKDLRSVKGFLKNAGLSIIKLGKGRWVIKDDFDAVITGLINSNTKSDLKFKKYQATGKAEKQFINDINSHLRHLSY